MTASPPVLTVIVPAYRCAVALRRCLDGLLASDLPRAAWELIVVDDCSGDDTPAVARGVADAVLTTADGPRGPAFARNVAAVAARGAVLVFVDADVVVSSTMLSGFAHLMDARPDATAFFGAYDEAPSDPGFVSQYRNLLHRYVHTRHPGEATTFWAGCGAVRRDAFLSVGGFDALRFPRPQIEDIELGYRMAARGHRILLAPELTARHLKRWTLYSMLRTDLRERAIPWMHLLMERGEIGGRGPLNLRLREKWFTGLAGAGALALGIASWSHDRRWLWMALASFAVIVAGNAPLVVWFTKRRGLWFALGVIPLRILFYLVGGVGAAWAIVTHRWQPERSPLPALDASTNRAVAH